MDKHLDTSYSCCIQFGHLVEGGKLEMYYQECLRMHGILLRGHGAISVIYFCPWCGDKLPATLQLAREKELKSLGYSEELIYGHEEDNLPNKYRTELWWRERIENGDLIEEDEEISNQVTKDDCGDFCCNFMNREISGNNTFICYLPYVREYGIAKKDLVDEMERIFYCPWCGDKLPGSLRTEWNRLRWNPARKDIPVCSLLDEEFMSDLWWKKCEL